MAAPVGVLADVNSHPKEGVFVPFFGIPACTATGIAMLALRANAVIVPMFAIWDEQKREVLYCSRRYHRTDKNGRSKT